MFFLVFFHVFAIFPPFCPGELPRGPRGPQGAALRPGSFEMDLDGASEEQVTEAATLALASALVKFQVEELSMVNVDGQYRWLIMFNYG